MPPKTVSQIQIEKRKLLGSRIRKARLDAGIGLRQLARSLGMSAAWVVTVERGDIGLDSLHLVEIAGYLRLPVGYFLEPEASLPVSDSGQPSTRLDWQLLYPGEEERARAHYEVDRIFQRIGRQQAPQAPPAAAAPSPSRMSGEKTDGPYQAFGVDTPPGMFPRTIRHSMGETSLQRPPERVIALDNSELSAVLQLGIVPVGVMAGGSLGFSSEAQKLTRSSKVVSTFARLDFEAIAAARPDLIISNKSRHSGAYAEFSKIAPTIYGEYGGLAWQQNFALYAQALGREGRAAAAIQSYEANVRDLNARLAAPRPTVSLIRVRAHDIRYYQRNNFPASVLSHLGFPRPQHQNVDDFALVDLDIDSIPHYAPAGLIVVGIDRPETNQMARLLLESKEWQGLEAVKTGDVMFVDAAVWFGSTGYDGAERILTDIAVRFGISTTSAQ